MTTAHDLTQAVAVVVAEAIKASGRSQRDVSSATGIPLVTLSRRLTGAYPFTVLEFATIAELLGTTATDLMLRAERSVPRVAA